MKKHIDQIRNKRMVTESNIIGIKKALNAFSRMEPGFSVSCTAPKVTADDVTMIFDVMGSHRPKVNGALFEKGKKYLFKYYKTAKGTIRANCPFSASQQAILDDLKEFRLVSFETISSGYINHHYPIYAAIDSKGNRFYYYAIPWQSGGNGPIFL